MKNKIVICGTHHEQCHSLVHFIYNCNEVRQTSCPICSVVSEFQSMKTLAFSLGMQTIQEDAVRFRVCMALFSAFFNVTPARACS